MPEPHHFNDGQERLEQEAVAWMVRLHSGETTESDRHTVSEWRSRSEAHERAFQKVERLWRSLQPLQQTWRSSSDQSVPRPVTVGVSRDGAEADGGTPRPRRIVWGALAASIAALAVMLAAVGGVVPFLRADTRAGTGEQVTVPLADGSLIVLNTQAAVSVHYSKEVRRVDLLAGEAAFRVAKDSARPFIVYSRQGHVRVVGTEFVVRESAETVVVTVMEGVVEVNAASAREEGPVPVRAGRRVAYGPSGMSPTEPADLRVVTAWQRGKLIFEATPLSVVIDEINRYRPGRIVLLSETLARHPVSGVFDLQRLDAALSTIEQTLPVTTYRLFDRFVFFR